MVGLFDFLDEESDLEQIKKEYEETKKTFESLPSGIYKGRLEKLEPKLSISSKLPMIATEFVILEGDFERRHYFHNILIQSGNNIYFANQFLKSLLDNHDNIDIEFNGSYKEYSFLISAVSSLCIGRTYKFEIKKSGKYDNVNILKESSSLWNNF